MHPVTTSRGRLGGTNAVRDLFRTRTLRLYLAENSVPQPEPRTVLPARGASGPDAFPGAVCRRRATLRAADPVATSTPDGVVAQRIPRGTEYSAPGVPVSRAAARGRAPAQRVAARAACTDLQPSDNAGAVLTSLENPAPGNGSDVPGGKDF